MYRAIQPVCIPVFGSTPRARRRSVRRVGCCWWRRCALPGLTGCCRPRWRRGVSPLTVHDPAKVLLDVAVSLALDGDCLADVGLLRAEPSVFGRVASDLTVSRLIDTFAADAYRALAAIESARAAARARVWALAGDQAPRPRGGCVVAVVIDLDATLVTSHSEKEQAPADVQRTAPVCPETFSSETPSGCWGQIPSKARFCHDRLTDNR